jgi:hypothetical protein
VSVCLVKTQNISIKYSAAGARGRKEPDNCVNIMSKWRSKVTAIKLIAMMAAREVPSQFTSLRKLQG